MDCGESDNKLTKEKIGKGLKQLSKNEVGAYGYVQLELQAMDIRSLEGDLSKYHMLQYIDMSHNSVESLEPLKALTKLHAINFRSNKVHTIGDCDFSSLPYLQIVELDNNLITNLIEFRMLHVRALTLSRNAITSLDPFEDCPSLPLQVLDLSYNQITSTSGIEFLKCLKILNLRGNKLTKLDGISALPELEQLDVRENQLQAMDSLAPLKDNINFSIGVIHTVGNVGIHPEGTEMEALISEVLIRVPQLARWNDIVITTEHRAAAKDLKKEREAEAAEKAEEAAAAAAAAAAEAEAEAASMEEGDGDGDGDGE